ncbi:unnamed protein product [Schistosoma curassoni]|uniref:Uncharacterized protein n=1 Tax=Schistosoma curassoni TaxID=6186 RepID=A0A183JRS5_9TREM|nr:unnamed protein product [Schistosoma curassoni]
MTVRQAIFYGKSYSLKEYVQHLLSDFVFPNSSKQMFRVFQMCDIIHYNNNNNINNNNDNNNNNLIFPIIYLKYTYKH